MKRLLSMILVIMCATVVVCAQDTKKFPVSMAYCLDGSTTRINGNSEPGESRLGQITLYYDKVIYDNNEVYKFDHEEDGIRIYEGPSVSAYGHTAVPYLFINYTLDKCMFFIIMDNGSMQSTRFYLMDMGTFNNLANSISMSTSNFVQYSYGNSSNAKITTSGVSSSSDNKYQQYCHMCHGSGKCNSCYGTHRILNPHTNKYVTCPNCKPDGICTHCGGTGKKR